MATYKRRPILERFLEKVSPEPHSGCWLWIGTLNNYGYGMLSVNYSYVLAHRLSYELHVGPIPEGLELDHLCRVRCCVNPRHLEPVTRSENTLRGNAGRLQVRVTHCPAGHAYDEANTYMYKRGSKLNRQCKQCHLIATRKSYRNLKPDSERSRH